jgi:hypothetical protein
MAVPDAVFLCKEDATPLFTRWAAFEVWQKLQWECVNWFGCAVLSRKRRRVLPLLFMADYF